MSNGTESENMDDLDEISESSRKTRYQPSPIDESICWENFFKDVGTQVEESDILQDCEILQERELLQERIAPDNSPALAGICATGVAETLAVGDYGQVFGTAKINTEPRLTFMFSSIRSAFDEPVTTSRSVVVDGLIQTLSKSVSVSDKPSYNLSTITSAQATSVSITLPPVTSQTMTSLPMTTTQVSPASIMAVMTLQPVTSLLSASRETNRSSPRLSPKQSGNGEVIGRPHRSPSPRPRDSRSPRNLLTASPTCLDAEKQTSACVNHSIVRRSYKTTSEQRTLEQSTPEKSTLKQSAPEKSTPGQNTSKQISLKRSVSENSSPKKYPVQLTPASNSPETRDLGTGKTGSTSLETSKTGYSSPEMTASTSSAGRCQNEQSHQTVSGKKRRRTGAKSSGKGRKSRTVLENKNDERELRGRLSQRIWDGTTFQVEEVQDIDFSQAELTRQRSRAGSLGRVSPNPNTRLRSRKNSKSSASYVLSTNEVISTSDVINNDVILTNDVMSTSDVISGRPSDTEGTGK